MKQLGELKSLITEKLEGRFTIIAISPDTRVDSRKIIRKLEDYPGELSFPILADVGHRVIDTYGLLNEKGRGPAGVRIPHPAVYLIDMQGIVRWRFIETDYKIRASNDMILEAISKMQGTQN